MKIRSVTSFVSIHQGELLPQETLQAMLNFNQEIRNVLNESEYQVQSLRCATNPFPEYLDGFSIVEAVGFIKLLEQSLKEIGFDYVSIGSVGTDHLEKYHWIPTILAQTECVFATAKMVPDDQPSVSVTAIKSVASIMKKLSVLEDNGFGNLYFAALAKVPGGIPFLPAAYKNPGEKGLSFALAMESADLAVSAFSSAKNVEEASENYQYQIETKAEGLQNIVTKLGQKHGFSFLGFDFTPAPYILDESSTGNAFEKLTGGAVGDMSSVSAAAFLMTVLDSAKFKRSGFNGLMLPVLEDNVLAKRTAEGKLSLKDLLLFSTVCGTGLDTVPLPGEISEEQLQSILLDVASLAVRLNKPLTARLMPIPRKKAGEMTSFDFPFFTNSRVMSPDCSGLSGLFHSVSEITVKPRF
jgi:uncharacterized protein (UPF0210 family)